MARGQNLLGKIYNKALLITLNDLHPIVDYLSSPERVASLRFEQDTQVAPQLSDYPLQEDYDKAMMTYLGINPETKVGVLNIDGTLVNREGQMNSQCIELTSYQGLKKKFESQIEMGVQSCVMMINSGGGECFGAWSTANYVQKLARQHNIKLTAYVNGTSASAAYVWASVADKVISHPLGQVGSIGVVVQLYNDSKMLDKMGVERSFVYAGGNKIPFDKQGNFTETFVKDLQDSVDKTYAKFVNHVAVNRNLTEQQVINTNASVFDADVALTLGLIDDVMELEDFEIPSHSLFKTDRWDSMLRSGSYYHIPYNVKLFEYNDISENYYLVVRSDFKNYQGEIGKFFDWITPYIKKYGDKTFIGYSLYEEATEPTLYYLKG